MGGYPRTIEAESGKITFANDGDVLQSGGLGPCIAIGIYDYQKKCGHMMHEANWHVDANLDERIEEILKQVGDKKKLEIYVLGNSRDTDDDNEMQEFVLENRKYVRCILLKIFQKKQIKFNWLTDDTVGDLILDTGTGKFEVVTSSFKEKDNEHFMD